MIKKVWGIRHLRYAVEIYKVNRHYSRMAEIGFLPIWAENDVRHLDEIWRGEA